MAGGPYDGQIYFDVRPQYPSEWYSMLSALTPRRALAWDVGTGNGQAAVGVTILSLPSLICLIHDPDSLSWSFKTIN
ncbi:hypothetical protein CDL15_Pgr022770 [Punica granatum]|uniref:Methyltransferase n=1 Tax=Punica granatum TaxID=22663 RepID=A0A218XRL5_PUNGR|nr:hypothetical protein CDL15_Pgr022770 [Punica granatum]